MYDFEDVRHTYAGAIARLARSYERDRDMQKDLQQEIWINLWKSLPGFKGACSMRSWVFRIAHNTAATHILRQTRSRRGQWVTIEEAAEQAAPEDVFEQIATCQAREVLLEAIRSLRLPDRQVIALYAEGIPAADISEITGLSPANISKKIQRFKSWLSRSKGASHNDR